jgi:membrane protein implicated in regulation of membrane protease activity
MKVLWIILAALAAFSTGRSVIGWAIATYFFGVFALIPLVFLSTKQDKFEERQDFVKDKVEQHLVKKEFKDVNTVDDLFNQLETK